MTISSRNNYNLEALQGMSTDDMEFIDNFKYDPSLAYTKELNDHHIQTIYQDNLDFGVDPKEAAITRKRAMAKIEDLYRKNGL